MALLLSALVGAAGQVPWTQIGNDIDGEDAGDYSGWSVAMSSDGTRIAVGAYGNDGNGTWSGHVRVYDYNGSAWNQIGDDIDGENIHDRSGHSVAMSSDGKRIAVGAPYNKGVNGTQSGHVRVYEDQMVYSTSSSASTSTPTSDDDGDDGLSKGAIMGIVTGSVVGAVALMAAVIYACRNEEYDRV